MLGLKPGSFLGANAALKGRSSTVVICSEKIVIYSKKIVLS